MMLRLSTTCSGAARLTAGLAACLLAVAASRAGAVAVAAAGPGAGAHADRAGFGTRLLLAQKDGRIALLLPESHIGSPAQEDRYFRDVIRPAFAASSAVLAERSNASWFDQTYDQATCPDEGEAEAVFDTALNNELRRHPPAVPASLRTVSPVDRIASMSRFIRFYRLFVDVQRIEMGKVPADATSAAHCFKVRNAQSRILLAEAPRRDISVENTGTWLRAYCAITPAQRAELIAGTVEQSAIPPPDAGGPPNNAMRTAAVYRINDAAYRQALVNLRATLRAPFPADHVEAPPATAGNANYTQAWTPAELTMKKFMVVERSRAWVADLPTVLARERLPFYALGAAHFADGPFGPGLVTLLREAGYTVSLVSDRRALNTALARLPPPTVQTELPLTMRTLAGGCQRDGDSYGCNWADKSTSYIVLNAQRSPPQEVWSACFERERLLGPESSCVSAIRRVGAERAADLDAADKANDANK